MPPIAIAAGIGAVGSVAGGAMQASAAGSAADKQLQASREANDLQWKMFQQQRDDAQPWRDAGKNALGMMGNKDFQRDFSMSDFQQDPSYQFRMDQGQKALERSAAARGNVLSPATSMALSRYGQDFASNEYNNAYNRFNADRDRRFNRLSSLAGIGQTANSQIANAGMNVANNVGQNTMGAANAAGAAGIAGANAWGNTLSNLGKLGMEGSWMGMWNKSQGGAGGIGGSGITSGDDYFMKYGMGGGA